MRKKYLIGSINSCASIVSTFGMQQESNIKLINNLNKNDINNKNVVNDIIKDLKCLGCTRFNADNKLYNNIYEFGKIKDNDLYIKEQKSKEYNEYLKQIFLDELGE